MVRHPLLGDDPRTVMAAIDLMPPLVSLGKIKQWQPLPLTIKQARRFVPRDQRSLPRSNEAETSALMRTVETGAPPFPNPWSRLKAFRMATIPAWKP